MTETRIRWEPTEPGGDDRFGYVGTLDRAVFTLWFPREDGVSWAVSAAIPGTGQEDAECRWGASREEATGEAERWLAEFVTSLGAVFPAELSESAAFQVSEARDLLALWDGNRGLDGANYSTERTLADQVRALLAIVDQDPAPRAAGTETWQ